MTDRKQGHGGSRMWKRFVYVLSQLYCRYQDNDVTAMAAQMTYYLILSLFPFLIFLITLMSYTPLASESVLEQLLIVLPETSYRIVMDIIRETVAASNRTLLSLGMLATVWTSSSGMMAIVKGINKAYDAEEKRPFWKVRGLSIVYTLVFAVLLLFTFVLLVFGKIAGQYLFALLHFPHHFEAVWSFAKWTIPVSMMIVVFALLYMQAPNYPVRPRNAWPGAVFAASGWIGASLLFSFYVNNFGNFTRTYGSIGGIMVLLIWIYISCVVILLGGELNATLQFMKENRVKPACKQYGFEFPWVRPKRRAEAPEPGR